jgi:hypothetical protein
MKNKKDKTIENEQEILPKQNNTIQINASETCLLFYTL